MTRDDFLKIWNIGSVQVSPPNAMTFVNAYPEIDGRQVWLNFDLYSEEDVYALGAAFFEQLREKLSELEKIAKEKIAENDLNWNNVELELSSVTFRKPRPGNVGFYSTFALSYEGGEVEDEEESDEDEEYDEDYEGEPQMLIMHVCFDENFQFTKAFNELIAID